VQAVETLYAHWRSCFPSDAHWIDAQPDHPQDTLWLTKDQLRMSSAPKIAAVAQSLVQESAAVNLDQAMGAMTLFFQRYSSDDSYRACAATWLHSLEAVLRERFLHILLPLVRRFPVPGMSLLTFSVYHRRTSVQRCWCTLAPSAAVP
jgi:hypothetical protein